MGPARTHSRGRFSLYVWWYSVTDGRAAFTALTIDRNKRALESHLLSRVRTGWTFRDNFWTEDRRIAVPGSGTEFFRWPRESRLKQGGRYASYCSTRCCRRALATVPRFCASTGAGDPHLGVGRGR